MKYWHFLHIKEFFNLNKCLYDNELQHRQTFMHIYILIYFYKFIFRKQFSIAEYFKALSFSNIENVFVDTFPNSFFSSFYRILSIYISIFLALFFLLMHISFSRNLIKMPIHWISMIFQYTFCKQFQ